MNNPILSVLDKALNDVGLNVTIGNNTGRAIIKDQDDVYSDGIDYKVLITKLPFTQGDIILVKNKEYMVVEEEEQFCQGDYRKGFMRRANRMKINNMNGNTISSSYNCYGCIDMKSAIMEDTSLITTIKDRFEIMIKDTNVVKIDDIILFKGYKYKVVSLDVSKEGITHIIAEFVSYVGTEYIITLNTNNIVIEEGATFQLVATLTQDGDVVPNPMLQYSSTNTAIATVSDTGLVTGITKGSATIKVAFQGVEATASTTVQEKYVPPAYEINITNKVTSLFQGNTYQLNCICKNSGEVVSNPTITYSSSNTSIATVLNTGLITVGSTTGDVTITASYQGVTDSFTITIKERTESTNIKITGTELIYKGCVEKYEVSGVDGFNISGKNFTWSLENLEETEARILEQHNTYCYVYADATKDTMGILSVEENTDTSLYKIKGIYYSPQINNNYRVTLDKSTMNLATNSTGTITATFEHKVNSTWTVVDNPYYMVSSSDETVATINKNGTVTAYGKEGSTTITYSYNGSTATCVVNVSIPREYTFTLNQTTVNPEEGIPFDLKTACVFKIGDIVDENPVATYTMPSEDSFKGTVDSQGIFTPTQANSTTTVTITYHEIVRELTVTQTWKNGGYAIVDLNTPPLDRVIDAGYSISGTYMIPKNASVRFKLTNKDGSETSSTFIWSSKSSNFTVTPDSGATNIITIKAPAYSGLGTVIEGTAQNGKVCEIKVNSNG